MNVDVLVVSLSVAGVVLASIGVLSDEDCTSGAGFGVIVVAFCVALAAAVGGVL